MARELTTGILISHDCVSWSTLQGAKGRVQETDQGEFPIPKPGDTESPDDRAEIISEVLKEHCSRLKGRVSLAMPTDQVLLKILDLPVVDDEDLPGIVEIQADKLSPFPIENMVVSHEVLHRTEAGVRVLVAAVQISQVETIGSWLRDVGLTVRRVDVEVLGWWSALQEAGAPELSGHQLIILLTGGAPTIILVNEGVPQIIRSIKTCEGLEGDALVTALGQEINFTLMSRELAGDVHATPAITVYAAEEVAGTIETGLQEASGATVVVKALASLPSCAWGVAGRATQARGGSRASTGFLDLTPPSWTLVQQSALFKKKMIRAAAAIVGFWLLTVGALLGFLYLEQHRLAGLKAEHDTIREPARQVRLLRRRARMIESYVDHRQSALECLREISRLQPEGIELTSFSYRKGDAVKITALGRAVGMVYDFQHRLNESEFFPTPVLKGPRTTRRGEAFDVTINLEAGDS